MLDNAMKTCKTCLTTKPLFDFYKQANRGGMGVRGSCKACDNIKKVAYGKINRERISVYKKQTYDANRQVYLDRKKEYRQNNKGKINAFVKARRAAKMNRTPAWLTEFDKLKIKCIYQMAAMYTKVNGEPWHVDHEIPLQGELVSGLHVPSNLRVMRGSENISKKNKFEVIHAQ